MSEPVFTYDVFLSHNQADKLGLRQLAERLRAAGLRQNDLGFRISDFRRRRLCLRRRWDRTGWG